MTTLFENVDGLTANCPRDSVPRPTNETNESHTATSSSTALTFDESAWDWFRRVQRSRQQLYRNPITLHYIDYCGLATGSNLVMTPQQALNLTSFLSCNFFLYDVPFPELRSALELYRRARNRQPFKNDDDLDDVILQTLSFSGTGIPLLDQLFQHIPPKIITSNESQLSNYRIHLDITGKSSTGKTPVLVSLAASFVVSTSQSFLGPIVSPTIQVEPMIFILDPEYRVSIAYLAQYVRRNVLRRWNQTELLRKALYHYQHSSSDQSPGSNHSSFHDNTNDWIHVEQMIASCLDRIHIFHPNSTTQIMAALEVIRHTLDQRLHLRQTLSTRLNSSLSICNPPDMILIDSLFTCFESIDKRMEDLPSSFNNSEKSGLSGRNDVVRQLKRIGSEHSICVAASRTVRGDGSPVPTTHTESWNKIVTHHLKLDRVVENSIEDEQGFDFVALIESTISSERTGQSLTHVMPFSITDDGIQCR